MSRWARGVPQRSHGGQAPEKMTPGHFAGRRKRPRAGGLFMFFCLQNPSWSGV